MGRYVEKSALGPADPCSSSHIANEVPFHLLAWAISHLDPVILTCLHLHMYSTGFLSSSHFRIRSIILVYNPHVSLRFRYIFTLPTSP